MSDRLVGGDWFSTVWLDVANTDERIELSYVDGVLTVATPKAEVSKENVKQLRLALHRLERRLS